MNNYIWLLRILWAWSKRYSWLRDGRLFHRFRWRYFSTLVHPLPCVAAASSIEPATAITYGVTADRVLKKQSIHLPAFFVGPFAVRSRDMSRSYRGFAFTIVDRTAAPQPHVERHVSKAADRRDARALPHGNCISMHSLYCFSIYTLKKYKRIIFRIKTVGKDAINLHVGIIEVRFNISLEKLNRRYMEIFILAVLYHRSTKGYN